MRLTLLSLLFVSTTALAAAQPISPPEGISDSCKAFLTKLEQKGWTGAWVDVPLDYKDGRSSERAQVFYYYHASGDIAIRTPILFINGGPLQSFQPLLDVLSAQVDQYDPQKKNVFVMMDQRGVGCSLPAVPTSPDKDSVRRMSYFGSSSIVKDAEQIRKSAFQNRQWKIFAQSFGGTIAGRYLVEYPKSISSVHTYAPTYLRNQSDFFFYRILKQNEVLHSFLEYGKDPGLAQAIEAAKDPSLCLEPTSTSPQVCGSVLLDGIIAGLGQGPGRFYQKTENWDAGIAAFRALISHDVQTFKTQFATPGLAFFRAPTILPVFAQWEEDFDTRGGNLAANCRSAYRRLRAIGQDYKNLAVDECRIVLQNVSVDAQEALRRNLIRGARHISQGDILKTLVRYPEIRFYLYSGEVDSSVNSVVLQTIARSKRVHYTHFENAGHAGWRFEPKVWAQLMQ